MRRKQTLTYKWIENTHLGVTYRGGESIMSERGYLSETKPVCYLQKDSLWYTNLRNVMITVSFLAVVFVSGEKKQESILVVAPRLFRAAAHV